MSETAESVAILVKALVGPRRKRTSSPLPTGEGPEVRAFLREEPFEERAPLLPVAPAAVKLFTGSASAPVVVSTPKPTPEDLSHIEERRAARYSTMIALPGLFDGTEVRIKDLSSTGFQIEHADRIPLRTSRMLRFVHPRSFDADHRSLGIPDRLFESHYTEFRCTTVWSRLHRETNNGPAMYRTGITAAPGESGPLLLPFLLREYLQPDSDGLLRKQKLVRERKERLMARSQELADQHLLVRTASSWLRSHPAELTEWRRRARFALGSGKVPHGDNYALGYTVEVVSIWLFLQHAVPLPTIRNAISALNEAPLASNG
jgi:hypothetical protein